MMLPNQSSRTSRGYDDPRRTLHDSDSSDSSHEYCQLSNPRRTTRASGMYESHQSRRMSELLTKEELKECEVLNMTAEQIKKKRKLKQRKIEEIVSNNVILANKPKAPLAFKSRINIMIVLFGKTGHGKSSTANLLSGREIFEVSDSSKSCSQCTHTCSFSLNGREYQIVDTPGLFDTNMEMKNITEEMAKCMDRCSDGVHVFLFVYNAATRRFTAEELATVTETKDLYGDVVMNHAAAVLTHTDTAFSNKDIQTYIDTTASSTVFGTFLKHDVKLRVMGINNAAETDYEKELYRRHLFNLIDKVIEDNHGNPYMDDDLRDAKRIREEQERKRTAALAKKERAEKEQFHNVCEQARNIADKRAQEYFSDMSLQRVSYHMSDRLQQANIIEQIFSEIPRDYRRYQVSTGLMRSIISERVHHHCNVRKTIEIANEKSKAEKEQNERKLQELQDENRRLEAEKQKAEVQQRQNAAVMEREKETIKKRIEEEKNKDISYHKEIIKSRDERHRIREQELLQEEKYTADLCRKMQVAYTRELVMLKEEMLDQRRILKEKFNRTVSQMMTTTDRRLANKDERIHRQMKVLQNSVDRQRVHQEDLVREYRLEQKAAEKRYQRRLDEAERKHQRQEAELKSQLQQIAQDLKSNKNKKKGFWGKLWKFGKKLF